MYTTTNDPIKLTRDVQTVAVPAGYAVTLPQDTEVVITQSLGGSFTLLVPSYGGLFRLASRDADAIGKDVPPEAMATPVESVSPQDLEQRVWQVLKTCYDPEIPVNIVDLGLVYDLKILPLEGSKYRIEIKMTLTAQGCGMGTSIAGDAQWKLLELPGVKEADVQVVWEPGMDPATNISRRQNCPRHTVNLDGLTILVVEDDTDTRELLRIVLEAQGGKVRTASSVAEALNAYDEDRPNVLVADIGMPEYNGYTLIGRVRARDRERGDNIVPAIALTAYATAIDRDTMLTAGFQVHMPKPFDPDKLVSVIADLASQYR